MTVKYDVSKVADQIRCQGYFFAVRPINWIGMVFNPFIFALGIFIFQPIGRISQFIQALEYSYIGWFCWISIIFAISIIKRTSGGPKTCLTTLYCQGVVDQSPNKLSAVLWKDTKRIVFVAGDIYFLGKIGNSVFVPRSAFESNQDAVQFYEAAKSAKVGDYAGLEKCDDKWRIPGDQQAPEPGVWPPPPIDPSSIGTGVREFEHYTDDAQWDLRMSKLKTKRASLVYCAVFFSALSGIAILNHWPILGAIQTFLTGFACILFAGVLSLRIAKSKR